MAGHKFTSTEVYEMLLLNKLGEMLRGTLKLWQSGGMCVLYVHTRGPM